MSREKAALIETLESRKMLSGATVVNGVLRVTGERLVKDVITVGISGPDTIVVTINASAASGANRSFSEAFDTSGITSVHIFGSQKSDHIAIDQSVSPFTLPTVIDGGRGNDVIVAGDENDTIFGGLGNDSINSGNGNDLVYGGPGADTLTGGDGNDRFWGGSGDDSIVAGNGTDTLGGIVGKNTLTGGTGHDTFYVSKLKNNVTNYNSAKDTLKITKHGDADNLTSGDPSASSI